MNTQAITIQGKSFSIPAPYAEGHVLNANEAGAVNQLFAENIRNNFAGLMKKAEDKRKEDGTTALLTQADLDKYAETYKFGVRSGSGPRLDPVEREMRKMAETQVKALLSSKNIALKALPEGKYDELVEKVLAKYGDDLRTRAESIVATQKAAVAAVADIDI